MALIKFGNGVSAIAGKIAGTVFARNRSGAYARNWARPVDPATAAQETQRGLFTYVSQLWASLGSSAQDAWNEYASLTPFTNRLGDTIHLTGANCFLKLNVLRLQASQTYTSTAPSTPGTIAMPDFSLSQVHLQESVGLVLDAVGSMRTGANDRMFYYLSPAVSPGIRFYKGPWLAAGIVAGSTLTPAPSESAVGFAISEGQVRWVRLRQICGTSGVDEGKVSPDQILGPLVVEASP